MKAIVLVTASLLSPTCVMAQDPRPPAASADSEGPSLFPRGYLRQEALGDALKRLAANHPERLRLRSLARTAQGRDVWLATLGRPRAAGEPPPPSLLIVANLEGDHLVGSQVALGLIGLLAAADGQDPEVTRLLDEHDVHVVPRLNPDGAERVFSSPRVDCRTNLRPSDRDRDGRMGEDGPDDINGDGYATRMRVRDAEATLIVDPEEPRLLRRADRTRGERPVFSEMPEGLDDDGDGLINEDPPGGVNLNRHWPHRWTEFDPEAGFSPASEPEVRALIQFAFDHPEIAIVWTFGLNDNLRTEPKKPDSALDEADLPYFAELVRLSNRAIAGRPAAAQDRSAPGGTTDGAMSEWAYHQYGAVGLASRLWTLPTIPDPPPDRPKPPADGEARWLYWNDHVMGGRAFVPFSPFDHPTLGPVEVGGWKPGVRLNPPIEQVEAIIANRFAFLKELGRKFAALTIPEVKAEPKGGGLYRISAVVENTGYLPTALAQGVRIRKALPVLVRLKADGAKILAGRALNRIEALPGSGGRQEFVWLILAPDAVKAISLEASAPKAGRQVQTIELER